MTRVLVADDHAIVRKGLGQIISETSDLEVAGEAANGAEVISLVMDGEYDAVVLDINMPGMDGLDALKQLQSIKPDIPVLVLSMHAEDEYALRVLKAGASGYLNKESAPEELVAAIRKISSGGKYMSSEAAECLLTYLSSGGSGPLHANLSDREFQVLCLLSSGKTVSQIADQLSLSVKTISTYRARILDKMQMKNNAELTHYAIKNNLVY
jgi:DNA-binding NarL/FixJ family response regulator